MIDGGHDHPLPVEDRRGDDAHAHVDRVAHGHTRPPHVVDPPADALGLGLVELLEERVDLVAPVGEEDGRLGGVEVQGAADPDRDVEHPVLGFVAAHDDRSAAGPHAEHGGLLRHVRQVAQVGVGDLDHPELVERQGPHVREQGAQAVAAVAVPFEEARVRE